MERSPTFRIPLRTLKGKKKPRKEDLCKILYGKKKVALVRLIDISGGFIAVCRSGEDIEAITSPDLAEELQKLGLEARVPPQINARRSVICRKLDPWIGQHSKEEIREELEDKQGWLRDSISEVVKFGEHSHVFKLVLTSTEMAEKVKNKGLLLFNMAVAPEQIESEVFVDVTTCFTCYALEDHIQKDCPHKDRVICSECAELGHVLRDCTNNIKKCINCGGGHRTMAMGCTAKKAIIKRKKQELEHKKNERQNETYANVARAVVREKVQERPILSLPKNPSTKVLTCILYAHMANIGSPGSFARELNDMLMSNGLQEEEMVFPSNPPSEEVLGVRFTEMTSPGQEEAQAQAMQVPVTKEKKRHRQSLSPRSTERRMKRLQSGEMDYETTDNDTEEEPTQMPAVQRLISNLELKEPRTSNVPETKYDAKDINLKVFTHNSNPFPKTITRQMIADGVRLGTYKYEYDSSNTEAEVRQALISGMIKISNNQCINAGPPERFAKLKTGRRQQLPQRVKQDKKMAHNRTMRRLKILSLNVNGWKTNGRSISNIIYKEDPDVVLISEHGVKEDEELKIFNYVVLKKNHSNERFDGAAIALKRNIQFREIEVTEESYVVAVLSCGIRDLVLVSGYQPPRRSYLPLHVLIPIFNRHASVLLGGDLNARSRASDYTTGNGAGNSLDLLLDRNIVSRVGPAFPTYFTERTATKPDIVLTNRNFLFNIHVEPGPLTTSDHASILITLSADPIQIPIKERKSYRRANWEGYREDLSMYLPADLAEATPEDVDCELGRLQSAMIEADNKAVPKIIYKTLPNPIITNQTKETEETYNIVLQDMITFGPTVEMYRLLRVLKSQYRDTVLHEKEALWSRLIDNINADSDPKAFWRKINKIIGAPRKHLTKLTTPQGEVLTEPEDQERLFRSHWEEVFKISEEDNEDFDAENEERVLNHLANNLDRLTPHHQVDQRRINERDKITVTEIKDTIKTFDQKAPGTSGLTKANYSEAPDRVVETLCGIYNACLNLGYFPDELKTSKMIFILKDGKPPNNVSSYRPISLLEFAAKIFEKILNSRLTEHLERNAGYSGMQHGFRSGRGTDTALAVISESIANARARGFRVDVVLRDVAKAFDKVWIRGLQFKILELNLEATLGTILCDYLEDRTTYITIKDYRGQEFALEAGVPQGGCLSPTLYSVYTADLPRPGHALSTTVQFADDITQVVVSENQSVNMMAIRTSREINIVNKFERAWKIKTNKEKFKIIPISRHTTGDIVVNDDYYPYSAEGRVLGLTLTTTGYKKHVENRSNEARRRLPTLFRLRNLTKKNKRNIYISLIRSILVYPPIPLVAQSRNTIKKLQRIQNSALYLVTDTRRRERRTSMSIHEEAGLTPINKVIQKQAAATWAKMNDVIEPETMARLVPGGNLHYKRDFNSTREAANSLLEPVYT